MKEFSQVSQEVTELTQTAENEGAEPVVQKINRWKLFFLSFMSKDKKRWKTIILLIVAIFFVSLFISMLQSTNNMKNKESPNSNSLTVDTKPKEEKKQQKKEQKKVQKPAEEKSAQQKPLEINPCAKNHIIVHVWVGTKPLPQKYQAYVKKCKDNIKLLGNEDIRYYTDKWNKAQPDNKIDVQWLLTQKSAPQTDILRKFYLYFESGIYADFDTEIDEECFEDIITDQIVFTNAWTHNGGVDIAEQNFMMVRKKFNPSLKRMIISEIRQNGWEKKGWRWDQCSIHTCFILRCQKHTSDQTWK